MAREVSFTNPAKQFPTFYYCCDRKARAACGQSFKLWQQATIDSTCHDNSIIASSRHIYMGVVRRAHPVRGEPHIQRNANGEVATLIRECFMLLLGT